MGARSEQGFGWRKAWSMLCILHQASRPGGEKENTKENTLENTVDVKGGTKKERKPSHANLRREEFRCRIRHRRVLEIDLC